MPPPSRDTSATSVHDATGREPATFLDVSDLLAFLGTHSVVSGIQRVLLEVLPHLERSEPCHFVCIDEARSTMVLLDRPPLAALLHGLRDASRDRPAVETAAREIWASRRERPPAVARPGDVVAVLGAGWMFAELFHGIQRMKQDGAAVVILLYDLIPVVFPGQPDEVIGRFQDYLTRAVALADRAPAISAATRRDFERYCTTHGWSTPAGGVTRLAGDQWTEDRRLAMQIDTSRAWPRPFVLFVSTIEVRKNHILALRAWERLIARHGREAVPDLVCVGRLGWKAFEFLERQWATDGLAGRIHVLTDSLPDARLAALYRDCQFTIYPSRYEGWGLPVAESLDLGRPVIAAHNSSIPEVGGDFVRYFPDDDLEAFVAELERYILDPAALEEDRERIASGYRPPTWGNVAEVIRTELHRARDGYHPVDDRIELDVEYGLGGPLPLYSGGHTGEEYLSFLARTRRLPMTGQYLDVERQVRGELVADVTGRARDVVDLRFRRPVHAPLELLVAIPARRAGLVVQVHGPLGSRQARLGRQGVLQVELGSGSPGETVRVQIGVPPHPVLRWPVVRSFLVTADAAFAADLAHRGAKVPVRPSDVRVVRRSQGFATRAVRKVRGRLRARR